MKNKDNGIKYIFTKGLTLIFIGLAFNLLALPVIGLTSPFWAILVSIIILAGYYYLMFTLGRLSADYCFKAYKRNLLREKQGEQVLKAQKLLEYQWWKGLVFSSLYYVWQVIVLSLALILKNKILNAIISFYNLSFANILNAAGAINNLLDITPFSPLFFIFIIAAPLAFEAGYIFNGEILKRQHQEIKMELKLFNS
ncbi:MAG TPA: hypothetical protein VIL03_04000 [Clostridia bacterium]